MALINKNANVNHVDNTGWTALHVAARNGRNLVASLLLSNGAKVELRDSDGLTAFEEAEGAQGNIIISRRSVKSLRFEKKTQICNFR